MPLYDTSLGTILPPGPGYLLAVNGIDTPLPAFLPATALNILFQGIKELAAPKPNPVA